MLTPDGDGQPDERRTLGYFALVSYIPDPLARFLDALRIELTPDCHPHAHLTILPPRPLHGELKKAIWQITEECRNISPFRVELGEIRTFEASSVVYLDVAQGESELREFYRVLNRGPLEYKEPFPYHPHITIAQDISAAEAPRLAQIATEKWSAYEGPRGFPVSTLSFVQHVAPLIWTDVAEVSTGIEVGVGG